MIRKYKFLFLALLFVVTYIFLVTLIAILIKTAVIIAKFVIVTLVGVGIFLTAFWLCVGLLYLVWSLFYSDKYYSFYLWVTKK